jgi:hypothetical protein
VLVGKIEVDAATLFGDTNKHCSFRRIEEGAGFELVTTTMQFMSRTVRISTAWGSPNVVSVPTPALKGVSYVD